MEVVGRYSGPIISDINDSRFLTGSYLAGWFRSVDIPEIYGGRDLCLDPNNIEYYCVAEEERQRRLDSERLYTIPYGSGDTISVQFVIPDDVRERGTYNLWERTQGSPDE